MSILQVDDFAADAEEVRTAVIAEEFATRTGPDGYAYTGICEYPVPQWFARIEEAVNRPIEAKLSCFRLNLKGELPHSWVHSDEICAQYASVLYLNPPDQCYGGTAFWKHRGLNGLDHMPATDEIAAQGLDPTWFAYMMNREWKDLMFWEMAEFVPMKFNRFITYPTSKFHSRYPFEAFGVGPEDGRLIWVCFYDLK